MDFPYNPEVVLMGIYPREMKTYVYIKIYIQVFTVVLYIISKNWKPPECPSMGERLNGLWKLHSMEYYSAVKRNELLLHVTTWISFKGVNAE